MSSRLRAISDDTSLTDMKRTAAPKKKPKDSQAINKVMDANWTFRFQFKAETVQGDRKT